MGPWRLKRVMLFEKHFQVFTKITDNAVGSALMQSTWRTNGEMRREAEGGTDQGRWGKVVGLILKGPWRPLPMES